MKRRLRNADYWILFAAIALSIVGVLVIRSTTIDTPREPLFQRHLLSLAIGALVFLVMSSIHYRYLDLFAYFIYGLAIGLLLLVLVLGVSGYGATRWLSIGPIRVQPSEAAKIATLLVLARFLAGKRVDPSRLSTIARVGVLVSIPMVLILRQPDLGTALAFLGLLVAVSYWAGTPSSWLFYLAALAVTGLLTFRLPPLGASALDAVLAATDPAILLTIWALFVSAVVVVLRWRKASRRLLVVTLLFHIGVGLASPHAWSRLETYQKVRVLSFLSPGSDPSGAGYQVIQSKIAIGSGRVTGKGYLRGTQKALAYLPQQHTDFVFSVVGEEFGFAGGVGVVGLFALVLMRGVRIARLARDRFASLLAAGAVGILGYHVFVNLFMTVGLAPVTGLPLPFLSYGGSFLAVTMALLGILQSVAMRRHAY